ncbi:MAG: SusD/RagB family nutrient-binding outer membrane lipoprotein, partial [Pedobacter sp.]|nr:SusD/RagB family nutrient-binding outer membrane lipoprotein [Pedobacter sp.]
MKKILLALVPALFMMACTKDLETLNVDPKKPLSVTSASLFTRAQHNFVDIITSANVNRNVFRLIEQQWQETTYIDESQYDFQTREIPDNFWDIFYRDVLNNFEASRKTMAVDITDPAQLKNQIAILDIMEVYSWHYMVTTFGNVPYTEALNTGN